MQRSFNYTGRKTIEKQHAFFRFNTNNDQPPEFDVAFNLESNSFPKEAAVFVEAHYKETRQRFDFGTVSKITPPTDRRLTEIDLSGPTSFRVRIVDQSTQKGIILASGDNFRVEASDDNEVKSSLLPLKRFDLGQVPWRVEITIDKGPLLLINKKIQNALERMRTDPELQAVILPAALREVLTFYLWNDEEADDNEHCARWLTFAAKYTDKDPPKNDCSDCRDWIDEVVEEFSEQFHLTDILVDNSRNSAK